MERFYKKALDKLGIDQQTFDSIVFASSDVEDKVVECLEYCFENVDSLEYISCMLLQYIADRRSEEKHEDEDDEGRWVTTRNGHHVHISENGEPDKGNENVIHAMSGSEKTSENNKVNYSVNPKSKDYLHSYGDTQEEFISNNIDELQEIFDESGIEGVNEEYYKFMLSKTSENLHEVGKEKAEEVLGEALSQTDVDGWFRNADSGYKARIVDSILNEPDVRNAAINIMYENYKEHDNESVSFEEWLDTPVKMYRGARGTEHISGDVFSAYTFDRKIAERFSVNGDVYEAHIKPRDTFGSVFNNGEAEIMVPAVIAPNGNKDSRYDKKQNAKEIREAKKAKAKNYKTPDGEKIEGFIKINNAAVPIGKNGDLLGKVGDKIEENESEAEKNTEINKNVLTNNGESGNITSKEEETEAQRKIRLAEEKRKRKAEAKAAEAKRIEEEKKKEEERKKKESQKTEEQKAKEDADRESALRRKGNSGRLTSEEQNELDEVKRRNNERRRKVASPYGINRPCESFVSQAKLDDHFNRHGDELNIHSKEEYVKRANDLLTKPCGGDIDGYMDEEGAICRFDRRTCEYVKGFPGGVIKTYFIPKYHFIGGAYNPNWVADATRYFENDKSRYEYNEEN